MVISCMDGAVSMGSLVPGSPSGLEELSRQCPPANMRPVVNLVSRHCKLDTVCRGAAVTIMTGTLQVSCARFLLRDTCKGTCLSMYNTRQAILTRGRLRTMSSETRPAREKHRTDLPQDVPTSVPSDARMQRHRAMDHIAHSFVYTLAQP